MFKKFLLLILFFAAVFAIAVHIASLKTPAILRSAIEKAINKKVNIQAIHYRFPAVFELQGFEILETADPFAGELSFRAEQVILDVSPVSISKKSLILNSVEVENADFVIRKWHRQLFHPLSEAVKKTKPEDSVKAEKTASAAARAGMPLDIHSFHLKDSRFKFMDYNVQEGGFVIELDKIEAKIKNIVLPLADSRTTYTISANLPQGRDQKTANVKAQGWTAFHNFNTDAAIEMQELYLPYFKPYEAQVTQATIRDGYLNSRIFLSIKEKKVTADASLEASGLLFGNYEEGDQLFGLKADEILSFLKDSSGKIKFQITTEWDIGDRDTRFKAVMRKSIERSLRKTVLGNVGNILEKTVFGDIFR